MNRDWLQRHRFKFAWGLIALLLAVLAGAILAGFVLTASVIWPLRHRMSRNKPATPPVAPGPEDHD